MKRQFFRYWLALNATALQAGAHAVKAYVGLALAHTMTDSVPALNWPQLGAVFAFAAIYEAANWLDLHPLPTPENPSAPSLPPAHELL